MATIRELQDQAFINACLKGWHDEPAPIERYLLLFHDEISEATKEISNHHKPNETYYGHDGKPEGVPSELADVVIRIMDFCGFYQIDLEKAIVEKMEFNKTRPYRHGGKKL